MHTRFISHTDGPPNDLNVDDIWITLVREARQICRESSKAAESDLQEALSVYQGPAGFTVFSRLVSSFTELGPPMDRVGRANLKENLQQIRSNCFPSIAKSLVSASWRPKSVGKTSFLETPVGIATEVLIDRIENPDPGPHQTEDISVCIEVLQRALRVQAQEPDEDEDDGCEVLYGQAGLLYALLRLRNSIVVVSRRDQTVLRSLGGGGPNLDMFLGDSSLATIVQSIVTRGRLGASHYASNVSSRSAVPSMMWSWHHKRYLGAGHGVAGILHVLLMCPVNMITPYVPDILQTVEWLMTYQDEEGNWPTSLKPKYSQKNDLVQWCHGAPGMLILFSTLIRRAIAYPSLFTLSTYFLSSLGTAIQRGASVVYHKGLLRKGVGLCHGVSGSVYALLAASDAMGLLWKDYEHSKMYFLQAIHLAHLATSYERLTSAKEMSVPDRRWSLYGGLAGMCCAWAEVYDRLGTTGRNLEKQTHELDVFSWCRFRSGMPGFDDLGEKEKV